jgi:hypothetical protein
VAKPSDRTSEGFWAYYRAVYSVWWAQIRHSTGSYVMALLITLMIVFLQTTGGLIRHDQSWAAVVTNVAPYAVVLAGLALYHWIRAPWRLFTAANGHFDQELDTLRNGWASEKAALMEENAHLAVQLQKPHINPSIIECRLYEIPHQNAENAGILAALLGPPCDTRVVLRVRLQNEYRVPTVVEHFRAQIDEPLEQHADFIDADRELSVPIEYGVPASGQIQFQFQRHDRLRLVRRTLVLTIIDGIQQETTASCMLS